MTGSKKYFLVFATSLFTLLMSFNYNFFSAASDNFFKNHQRDSESLVLGRMVQVENSGFLSNGGVMGRFHGDDVVGYQYRLYSKDERAKTGYIQYRSNAGFQGAFYSVANKILRIIGFNSGEKRLSALKFITSALLAVVLSVFLLIVYEEAGFVSVLVTLFLTACSQWLVVFSNNLYWIFFLTILAFIFVVGFLKFHEIKGFEKFTFLYLGVFFIIFIKSLAGYEYISTILISAVIPFIYFAFKNRWKVSDISRRVFYTSISSLLGFFMAILVHVSQLSIVLGGFYKGVETVWYTVAKRTHGDPDQVHERYRQSLESNVVDVLEKYWGGYAFDLHSLLGLNYRITFGQVIMIMAVLTGIYLILLVKMNLRSKTKRSVRALMLVLWVSMLAPLSWYVLAKGHSYIHGHLNHVLWYIPFLLIGFSFIGLAFGYLWNNGRIFLRKKWFACGPV